MKIKDITTVLPTNNIIFFSRVVYVEPRHLRYNGIYKKEFLDSRELPKKTLNFLRENDILICKDEDVHDIILIDNENKEYIYSKDFIVIRALKEEDTFTLYSYLLSDKFKKEKSLIATGKNKKSIKVTAFRNLEIIVENKMLLFDITKDVPRYQKMVKQIYTMLEKNNTTVQNSINHNILGFYLKDIPRKNMFNSITIPETWEFCQIKDISNKIITGEKRNLKYTAAGVPIISCENSMTEILNKEGLKFILEKDSIFLNNGNKGEHNDFLINAKTKEYQIVEKGFSFNFLENMLLIKLDQSKINALYLDYIFKNENFKKIIKDIYCIDDTSIGNIYIPLPNLKEQSFIIDTLQRIEAKETEIQNKYFEKLKVQLTYIQKKINKIYKI